MPGKKRYWSTNLKFMLSNLILILKLLFFFSIVRWQTHNMPVTLEIIRVMFDIHVEAFLMFLKFRKFHFLLFCLKHRKFIADVKHDYGLLSEFFGTVTYVTATVLIKRFIESCSHPIAFISFMLVINYFTMPIVLSWEILLEYFYPLPGLNWEERLLGNPDFFLNNNVLEHPPISKEEQEALNKAIQGVKLESLETPEGKQLHEEEVAKKKEEEFREKLRKYNFLTAYLAFNISIVIFLQALRASREGGC